VALPAEQRLLAAGHAMQSSDAGGGLTRATCSVVDEDAVLLLRRELLHGCWRSSAEPGVAEQQLWSVQAEKALCLEDAQRAHERGEQTNPQHLV
jgi:hypothetical protein